MLKLSIIVPVYNAEKTLKRCLDSIIMQKVDYEVVIIDDGSTDNSIEIYSNYKRMYPNNFIIHKKENGGVATARNIGLDIVKGDYITFMDNDDELELGYYRSMLDAAETNNADIIISGITSVQRSFDGVRYIKGKSFNKIVNQEVFAKKYYTYHQGNLLMTVWNKLYKKDVVKDIYFELGRINGEDYLFNLNVYKRCNIIQFVDIYGYLFYQNECSASHRLYRRYDELHELNNSMLYRNKTDFLLTDIGVPKEDILNFHKEHDYIWFYYMIKNLTNPGTPYTKKEIICKIKKIMSQENPRECIIYGNRKGRLAALVRLIYMINSPNLAYLVFKFMK